MDFSLELIAACVTAGFAFALALVKLTKTTKDDEIVGKLNTFWHKLIGK